MGPTSSKQTKACAPKGKAALQAALSCAKFALKRNISFENQPLCCTAEADIEKINKAICCEPEFCRGGEALVLLELGSMLLEVQKQPSLFQKSMAQVEPALELAQRTLIGWDPKLPLNKDQTDALVSISRTLGRVQSAQPIPTTPYIALPSGRQAPTRSPTLYEPFPRPPGTKGLTRSPTVYEPFPVKSTLPRGATQYIRFPTTKRALPTPRLEGLEITATPPPRLFSPSKLPPPPPLYLESHEVF
jgi:hypothetical protein